MISLRQPIEQNRVSYKRKIWAFIKVSILCMLVSCPSEIYAQPILPTQSPRQIIQQRFADLLIELNYSRPSLKNRSVFEPNSELAPLGELWRLGANYATTIRFTAPVLVSGQQIDSGRYAVFAIPGKATWEIIFNKGIKNWGAFGYKKEEDVIRFFVPVFKQITVTETLSFQFANIGNESIDLTCSWGDASILIHISREIRNKIRCKIKEAFAKGRTPYEETAQFYFEYEDNMDSTLFYINKAIENSPNEFSYHLLKARALMKLHKYSEAIESAKRCKELAIKIPEDHYIRAADKVITECSRMK